MLSGGCVKFLGSRMKSRLMGFNRAVLYVALAVSGWYLHNARELQDLNLLPAGILSVVIRLVRNVNCIAILISS